jgi:prophage regulatory protein
VTEVTSQKPDLPDRLIDAKERRLLVPYSDMHIWRLEREGKFPKRIKIGPNRVAWRLSEILAWVDEKADARD